jgi:hypothetical protein
LVAPARDEARSAGRRNDARSTNRQERRWQSSRQSRRAIERDGTEQRRDADDAVRSGNLGERRWERDGDQGWGWGHERGDGYSRDDGRRAFGRGSREETFGRSAREGERVTTRGGRDRDRVIEREPAISRSPRDHSGIFGLFRNDW